MHVSCFASMPCVHDGKDHLVLHWMAAFGGLTIPSLVWLVSSSSPSWIDGLRHCDQRQLVLTGYPRCLAIYSVLLMKLSTLIKSLATRGRRLN